MYWTGSHAAIVAAASAAWDDYKSRWPVAYLDGEEVPNQTRRWARPFETATPGVWAIPAYPDLDTPEGCEVVDVVEWPGGDS